jgi:hypothetical protein
LDFPPTLIPGPSPRNTVLMADPDFADQRGAWRNERLRSNARREALEGDDAFGHRDAFFTKRQHA